MSTTRIGIGSVDDFFDSLKRDAKAADAKRPIARETVIRFADPAEFFRVMTPRRLEIYRAAKRRPGTLKAIASEVHRAPNAVYKDVRILAEEGLLITRKVKNPGHGVITWIEPKVTGPLRVEAIVA